MTVPGWPPVREPPRWVWDLEPATTGLLGQEGVKMWVGGPGAALGIRAGGVVYPVLTGDLVGPEVETGLSALLGQLPGAWCAMGPRSWVDRCLPFFPPSVMTHRVEYEFLVRPLSDVVVPPGPGVLRKAEPADGNALYLLQEGYEKEEVLFSPSDYQPLASRLNLGRLLRQQEIVGLWENGKPVAKAGTNALTALWAQVGGVYTLPAHRGRGHQKRLMAFLLERLGHEGRGACLFVKKGNLPALGLYRGLGFLPAEDFLILYGDRTR